MYLDVIFSNKILIQYYRVNYALIIYLSIDYSIKTDHYSSIDILFSDYETLKINFFLYFLECQNLFYNKSCFFLPKATIRYQ